MKALTAAVVVVVVLLTVLLAKAYDAEEKACKKAGGSYELDHYVPVMTYVNKVMVVNNVPVYECRHAQD